MEVIQLLKSIKYVLILKLKYQETSIIVEIVMFITGIIVTVLAWWFTKYCFSNYGSQLKLDKQ